MEREVTKPIICLYLHYGYESCVGDSFISGMLREASCSQGVGRRPGGCYCYS